MDKSGFLDRMVGLLGEHWIRCCVGAHTVNAYAEPQLAWTWISSWPRIQRASVERVLAAALRGSAVSALA